ncbi:MAG: TlpA disulfide reductase family protein [Gemmatimonadota bacterium]|nr:TlpA disulfide reductase family protein [Gemmatimonadota bacterium]MDE2870609.1 TlpA disulfide reductase family protein [Gemmatimonadota bacterium]
MIGARGAARVRALTALFGAGVLALAWLSRQGIRPVVSGSPAPDFAVTLPDGEPVTLDSYRGRVVLLNVWATWCAPCREEMPSMQRLYDRFGRDDFEIAAISIDAPRERRDARGNPGGDPVAFARELGLTFPILLDSSGGIQRTYRTSGVPESFLIGRDGIIYKKVAGPTDWDSKTNVDLVRRLAEAG